MPWPLLAAAALGGVGSYLGAKEQQRSNRDSIAAQGYMNRENIKAADRMAAENRAFQKDFATMGIQWKVADAKAAGLHPAAALGASGYLPPNQEVGQGQAISEGPAVSPAGSAMESMGQNLSRANYATRDQKQRAEEFEKLKLQSAQMDVTMKAMNIAALKQVGPPLPSNADMPRLTGQSQHRTIPGNQGYVEEVPAVKTHSQPGRPAQEVGAVADFGYTKTRGGGLAVIPGKDIKERIEDQIVPETMWAIRNQIIPNIRPHKMKAPNPTYYPLPRGYDAWKWSRLHQEWRPWKSPDYRNLLKRPTYMGRPRR